MKIAAVFVEISNWPGQLLNSFATIRPMARIATEAAIQIHPEESDEDAPVPFLSKEKSPSGVRVLPPEGRFAFVSPVAPESSDGVDCV